MKFFVKRTLGKRGGVTDTMPAEIWTYEDLVHPILIYADLLATGNERNIETARMIYDQHIVQLIRED